MRAHMGELAAGFGRKRVAGVYRLRDVAHKAWIGAHADYGSREQVGASVQRYVAKHEKALLHLIRKGWEGFWGNATKLFFLRWLGLLRQALHVLSGEIEMGFHGLRCDLQLCGYFVATVAGGV